MESPQALADRLISRRSFNSAVAASAAMGISGPLATGSRASTELAPIDRMSAAVVGTGGISRFHAANNFKPCFEIKAICDVDQASADWYNDQFASGQASVCGDHRELLDRDDLDVLFICTPDHWHTKIAVDALRSGKDVYCEKPLTLTVAEGELIKTVLGETDRVLQVGTQQRSDPKFQMAVAVARSGRLGPVKRITVAIGGGPKGGPFQKSAPPPHLNWDRWLGQAPKAEYIPERCHGNFRWWYEYSGGKLTDWGAHHVDIAQWAIGPSDERQVTIDPVEFQLAVPFEDGMPTVDDCYNTATTFRVVCRYSDGPELVISDQANDLGFDNGVLIECEEGRFFVNRGKLTGAPIEQLAEKPLPPEQLPALRKGRDVMTHMANFYHSCRDRSEPLSDAASHMQALNLCHVANVSMRLDRQLVWDPNAVKVVGDEEANRWLTRPQREGYEVV